jgi:DNA-binding MarR family transcriptional regulator
MTDEQFQQIKLTPFRCAVIAYIISQQETTPGQLTLHFSLTPEGTSRIIKHYVTSNT